MFPGFLFSSHSDRLQFLTGDLPASERHIAAAVTMVTLKGGLSSLGLDGFLEKLVVWFSNDPQLKSNAILEHTCVQVI